MPKYNYWEAGGRPTSYSPLDTSWNNKILLDAGEFIITYKAKSLSNGEVQWSTSNDKLFKKQRLTDYFQEYRIEFSNDVARSLFLYSWVVGDVEVKDIQVVEKPLGKATINGIDGFQSGKWSLHPNAKIIDDETLELNPTAGLQISELEIAVQPNTEYTISVFKDSDRLVVRYRFMDNSISPDIFMETGTGNVSRTFTTGSSVKGIFVRLYDSRAAGKYTFKKPMLNLGTTPVPYEKKRGERMVPPQTAGKNLVNPLAFESGSMDGAAVKIVTSNRARLPLLETKVGTLYTASAPDGWRLYVRKFNAGQPPAQLGVVDWSRVASFTGSERAGITIAKDNDSNFNVSDIPLGFQLEEGPATSYEPYRARTTRKATKDVPGKNLFPYGNINFTGVDYSTRLKKYPINLSAGTYSLSFIGDDFGRILSEAGGVLALNGASFTLASGQTVYFYGNTGFPVYTNIQVEKGSAASTFEPFRLGLRKTTVNGIDGFQSGKWISVNGGTIEVLDDETVKLTATGTYNNYRYTLEVQPNTEYTFSSEHNGQSLVSGNITGTDAFAGGWSSAQAKTFNSGNRSTVYLFFSSGTLGAGVYTFKKPMLNLGPISLPYEKKRGDVMIVKRKAPKGLELNGTNALISVPSPHNGPISKLDISIDLIPGALQAEQALIAIEGAFKLDITAGRNLRFLTGDNWGSTTSLGKSLPSGRLVRIRATFDGTSKKIYMDDIVGENYTSGVIPTPNQAYSLSFGARNASSSTFASFLAGVLLRAKVVINDDKVFEYDFTNPSSILGTKVKAKNGPDATINGNPVQLNRLARR